MRKAAATAPCLVFRPSVSDRPGTQIPRSRPCHPPSRILRCGSQAAIPSHRLRHLIEARVLFRRSAKEARWRASESLTLLELAQTVCLELPFSCRSGYCQTRQRRIIEGEARYAFAPLCAPAPDHALLCCARPASAVLVLDA
jgi:ferredoxin